MRKNWKQMWLVAVVLFLNAAYASGITIDWVTIGNQGNLNDDTGYGSVAYEYKMAQYEVTNNQYLAFLNAVAKTDTYGLYTAGGAIVQNGVSGNYSYSLKDGDANWGNKPVVMVSWYSALRFANWIHNGQMSGAQDATTTEDGAYTFSGSSSVGARNAGALVWLPSENEWYKAAYYSPSGVYYDYATGTDTAPDNNAPTGDSGTSANYYSGGYSVGSPYYTTDVGAYSASASPYNTYDQNGNVWEWQETPILAGIFQTYRGGSYAYTAPYLAESYRNYIGPTFEGNDIGFRLASDLTYGAAAIPEPVSLSLLAMSMAGLAWRKAKRA